MSLDEVRAAIDGIDDQIVALLAQRQRQVVAAAHRADEASVRAPERRATSMARLRERAALEGVDPVVVAVTYTAMVDAFTALEARERRAVRVG